MLPQFLLPETTIREAGNGPEIALGEHKGGCLVLTFGITRIIEQESIDLSIWASADGADWGTKPILAFPQKFYCGTYQLILDLSEQPGIAHLRTRWNVNRWGKGEPKPLFDAYVFMQAMAPAMAAGVR
ncbi:MAG: hypothetical protein KGN36_17605 [Acidobacteriota bacterium]|nr:hypothetical protein [Acidobacteriota bacterium]